MRPVLYLDDCPGSVLEEYGALTLEEIACIRKVLKVVAETARLEKIASNLHKDYGGGLHGIRCELVRLYFGDLNIEPDAICLLTLSRSGKGGHAAGNKRQSEDIDLATRRLQQALQIDEMQED